MQRWDRGGCYLYGDRFCMKTDGTHRHGTGTCPMAGPRFLAGVTGEARLTIPYDLRWEKRH